MSSTRTARTKAKLAPIDVTKKRSEACRRGEAALRELWLSVITEADKRRLWRVDNALHALDDVQADTKAGIEEALERHARDGNVATLVESLRALLARPPNVTPELAQ